MRRFIIFLPLFLATACATTDSTPVSEASSSAVDQTRAGLGEAALAPLEDLNLRRTEIPAVLAAIETPYQPPADSSCTTLTNEISALNAVLGLDADIPPAEDDENEDRTQWAADRSADAALGAVASEARSLIPFRGLVREATGANSHAARVDRAYQYGVARRAYLKGLGQAGGCGWPAAPLQPKTDPEPKIIYRQ